MRSSYLLQRMLLLVSSIMRRYLFFPILLLLGLFQSAALKADVVDSYNPIADSAAVVTSGNARFTVLTPRLIRIQYSNQKKFEERATFGVVNRRLPVPEYSVTQDGTYLYIKTSALTLRYRKNATIYRTSSTKAVLSVTFDMNGSEVEWYPGKKDTENLKGTCRTLDGDLGDARRSNMENGLVSRSGWAVIDESPAAVRSENSHSFPYDKKVEGMAWLGKPVDQNAVDLYLLAYGHDYKQAISDYVKIGGREPLPPRYVFGYWYSRYWAYTTSDYFNLVSTMQKDDIPLDVMILDMYWHTDDWTGWTWNTKLILNPKALLKWLHGRNLKTSLNLHPADGVDSDETGFEQLRKDMGLSASVTNVPWTLEDSNFYKNMFKDIIRPLENTGVDFWWLDWQQNLLNPRVSGLSETFWLNHVFYNDMRLNRPTVRPVIFHRWGGLGSHRYPIGFSGDAVIDYSTLDFETYFTATASNVCFGYWGHDLGGHQRNGSADPNDPELYLRWMQFGAFTPIFRTHATNDGSIERRIWLFSNFDALRDVVHLRYAMMPYIYTMARKAYDTGISICRPLYYYYPEDDEAYSYENEYFFGDDILVAPVTTAVGTDGLAWRKLWLPEGQWFDVTNNKLVEGGKEVNNGYTVTQIPYYYKAGSVVSNYDSTVVNLQKLPEQLILKVVPGGDGTGEFYDDNGDNQQYENGQFIRIPFTQTRKDNVVSLTIGAGEGSYEGMPEKHSYEVQFLGEESEPVQVTLNGKVLAKGQGWTWDSATHIVTVQTGDIAVTTEAVVQVTNTTTGINKVQVDDSENAPAWNLAGQPVGSAFKGIVVKKGWKVMVRH